MDIAALRKELGLSQEGFAMRLGLKSKAHVSAIESGKATPGIEVAFAIERLSGGKLKAADLNASVAAVLAELAANDALPQNRAA